jgi:hypothetical protein
VLTRRGSEIEIINLYGFGLSRGWSGHGGR